MGQQTRRGYKLDQNGQEVQDLLDKIDDIGLVTSIKNGLMLATDKDVIDSCLSYLEIDELLNL